MLSKRGLSSTAIKYIAICAMLIDHIAWAFIPTNTLLGQIMHIIGRITAPTMCYFIAEGYYHTHDVKKYALRLGIFAVISHCPFIFFEYGQAFVSSAQTGVIYTLFLGLTALWVWDKVQNIALRIILVAAICYIAIPGDWMFFGVLWVLAFGIFHGNFKKQILAFTLISLIMAVFFGILPALNSGAPVYLNLFQFGVFLSLPLIAVYNGKRSGGKYSKWIFYIFYPLHLIIIGIIKFYIL